MSERLTAWASTLMTGSPELGLAARDRPVE
jgi:hypothetical protein